MKRGRSLVGAFGVALLLVTGGVLGQVTHADTTPSDFNLQVSPSPLVTTVQPGVKTHLDLKVHNSGSGSEDLKIEPRSFTFDSKTGKVNLQDTSPGAIAGWVSFSSPKFTVPSGQSFTEQVILNVPKSAGFSYSFALVISRQKTPTPTGSERIINGSLAVFTLVNVDRPGAKSDLHVVNFSVSRHLYEYLPASLSVRFSNVGNTIVQPYGNIFIQRSSSSKDPLATLAVNETQGYILPGTERTVTASWNDGFATYQPVSQPDGSTKNHLSVDWSKLSHFRIGRYTAHLVAVYNDGHHDVPIEGTVTFWVIPWRAILAFIAIVVGLWFLGRWRNKRRTEKAVKRALAAQAAANKPQPAKPEKTSEKES